jgi:hypothetical protein
MEAQQHARGCCARSCSVCECGTVPPQARPRHAPARIMGQHRQALQPTPQPYLGAHNVLPGVFYGWWRRARTRARAVVARVLHQRCPQQLQLAARSAAAAKQLPHEQHTACVVPKLCICHNVRAARDPEAWRWLSSMCGRPARLTMPPARRALNDCLLGQFGVIGAGGAFVPKLQMQQSLPVVRAVYTAGPMWAAA